MIKQVKGCTCFTDESGSGYYIDDKTGEVVYKAVSVTTPVGSVIRTPAELNAIREFYNKKEYRKNIQNEMGAFFFIPTKEDFSDISPASATRLIFLATFCKYDTGELINKNGKRLFAEDLPKLLRLGKNTSYAFLNEVSPKYIKTAKDGLRLNTKFFIRGKIAPAGKYEPMQTFYINGIRSLYYRTDSRRHKSLGYIYRLLPYINIENNILCRNPFERDINFVESMTFGELCDIIGYEKSNALRLLKIYENLTFIVSNNGMEREEAFLAVVSTGANILKGKMFVNPHIIYGGSDFHSVYKLSSFCVADT